jgi:single-stranded-DNA-specific exonuclease
VDNIVKSVRGLDWTAKNRTEIETFEGIPDDVVSIAVNREVGDLNEFFSPTLKGSMPDPYVLREMKEAVERTALAVEQKQKITVYGDYDVDGATSSSILVRYLRHVGCEVEFYIPDRLAEGYGPNVPAFEKIIKEGTQFIICADSGTMAFEPLNKAKELGVDVVVIDHHQQEKTLPEGIIVNPNRTDETGEYGYLCTAGLAFLFVVGLQRHLRNVDFFSRSTIDEYDLKNFLGVVALGTVADVVPLRGLNRAYVKLGLPMMDRNPGLMGLAKANEVTVDTFSTRTCGFIFGPCINAGGRIDSTRWGTELLTCDDQDKADKIATHLFELNKERRAIQEKMENAAHEQAREQKDSNVIVIYGEDWHPGVVGIVASRIKDSFDKSAIVIGEGGKGSARSVDGFDIGEAIIQSVRDGISSKGGGHRAAGGLTIEASRIDDLRDFMRSYSSEFERPPLKADVEYKAGSLTTQTVDSFKMLQPFGMGNSEPRVIFTGGILAAVRPLKNKHIKATLKGEEGQIDVIMFNCIGTPMGTTLMEQEGNQIDLLGRVEVNRWRQFVTVQIKPEDLRIPNQNLPQNAFSES